MASLIDFPPEFYAMVTAFWTTYESMFFLWLAVIAVVVILLAFGIAIAQAVKPWMP